MNEFFVPVHNMKTGKTMSYYCSPKKAVIAAYAQERMDFNTWNYEKYDEYLEEGRWYYFCGDWAARKDSK